MANFISHCLIFLGLAFALIWISKYIVILALPHLSLETEASIGRIIRKAMGPLPDVPEKYHQFHAYLQNLVDRAVKANELGGGPYKAWIIENSVENAIVLPGGEMIFHSSMLSEIKSENELMMIIGHELGHCRNRDHLTAMGPAVVTIALLLLVSGTDSGSTDLLRSFTSFAGSSFSRAQERAADLHGLETLFKIYGHGHGAEDFFVRMKRKKGWDMTNIMGTHPTFDSRIKFLDESRNEMALKWKADRTNVLTDDSSSDESVSMPPLTPLKIELSDQEITEKRK